MKRILLILSILVFNPPSHSQSIFFDNLNNSIWTSTAEISDSILKTSKQIPISKLIYSKDSIDKDVTIWLFKDGFL